MNLLIEYIPTGDVAMRYNIDNETFEYFCSSGYPLENEVLEKIRQKFSCNQESNKFVLVGSFEDAMFGRRGPSENRMNNPLLELMARKEDEKWNKIHQEKYNSPFEKRLREQTLKRHIKMNGGNDDDFVDPPYVSSTTYKFLK